MKRVQRSGLWRVDALSILEGAGGAVHLDSENVAIVEGDSRKFLAALPGNSVDAVLTDPPYDDRTHAGAVSRVRPDQERIEFAAVNGDLWFLPDLLRVSRGWVLCCCALEQLGAYQAAAGDRYIRGGVWRRIGTAPQMSGDRPAQAAEGVAIMWGGDGRMAWNHGGHAAYWEFPIVRGSDRRGHATPKPEGLGSTWALQFTAPRAIVLDPFVGSGGVLRGVVSTGRRGVGFELERKHARDLARELQGIQVLDFTGAGSRARQGTLLGGERVRESVEEVSDVEDPAALDAGGAVGSGGNDADGVRA